MTDLTELQLMFAAGEAILLVTAVGVAIYAIGYATGYANGKRDGLAPPAPMRYNETLDTWEYPDA